MRWFALVPVLALPILALGFTGCSDDDEDLVTVTGRVLSIERGICIPRARVWLLDNRDKYYSSPVGADCRFTLQVPKGSPFILVTDDEDEAAGDSLIQLINFDPLHTATIDDDMADILVHVCPSRDYWLDNRARDIGSVNILDEYLSQGDASNGNLFEPASYAAAAAGGIAAVTLFVENGQFASQADMGVTIDSPDWPVGYLIFEKIWSQQNGFLDASLGPDTFFPASRDRTDESGLAYSFGKLASTAREVTVTLTDRNATRGLDFGGPWRVPVRPHALTMLLPTCIDGECGKTPKEGFDALQ